MRTNSKYVADTDLSALAAKLKDIDFEERFDEHREFIELGLEDRLINVAMLMDGKTYRVRMYLGGKQRCIGLTTVGPHAARFADMARLFFWPYRVRDIREPVATDMNYSVQQAQDDLNENEAAKALLEAILKHLTDIEAIKVRQPGEREPEKRRSSSEEVRNFLADQQIVQEQFMTEVRQLLGGIVERLNRIETNLLPDQVPTPGHPDNPVGQ